MGSRSRRRQRDQSRALATPPDAPERTGSAPHADGAAKPWADPQLRRAERRRVLLLSLLPGPFQRLARSGRAGLLAAVVVHALLVLAVGLLLLRVVSGQWLPPYAGVTVLALGVASQFACRAVNGRAQP